MHRDEPIDSREPENVERETKSDDLCRHLELDQHRMDRSGIDRATERDTEQAHRLTDDDQPRLARRPVVRVLWIFCFPANDYGRVARLGREIGFVIVG